MENLKNNDYLENNNTRKDIFNVGFKDFHALIKEDITKGEENSKELQKEYNSLKKDKNLDENYTGGGEFQDVAMSKRERLEELEAFINFNKDSGKNLKLVLNKIEELDKKYSDKLERLTNDISDNVGKEDRIIAIMFKNNIEDQIDRIFYSVRINNEIDINSSFNKVEDLIKKRITIYEEKVGNTQKITDNTKENLSHLPID